MMTAQSFFSVFSTVLMSDLRLAYRKRGELLVPLVFFVMVASLFPLALKPNPETLLFLGPAVIWIAALLGTLLALNNLFYPDFADGSLELLLLSPYPLAWLTFAKVLAHWLVAGLPLVLISPFIALSFGFSGSDIGFLMLGLLLGTPILSLIGAMVLSLTIGLRNGGVLLSLLVLPLYIPVLIFGVSAVSGAEGILSIQILWLAAIFLLSLSLCPPVTAFALRMSIL